MESSTKDNSNGTIKRCRAGRKKDADGLVKKVWSLSWSRLIIKLHSSFTRQRGLVRQAYPLWKIEKVWCVFLLSFVIRMRRLIAESFGLQISSQILDAPWHLRTVQRSCPYLNDDARCDCNYIFILLLLTLTSSNYQLNLAFSVAHKTKRIWFISQLSVAVIYERLAHLLNCSWAYREKLDSHGLDNQSCSLVIPCAASKECLSYNLDPY
jgi:hypothetical protein